ncbi:MAG TPA: L-aspartate oxidase [Stellaceae bacterium]|jgi:L-aspartate oxidase|nr:L-aspartate oxidase [Stellaceae bacterium]
MPYPSDEFIGRPVIIGAGLAGLITALHLAPEKPIVLSKAALGTGAASAKAQGGVAAAIGQDDDPRLHAADTIAAGDGLSDAAVVAQITGAGMRAIDALIALGVRFDRAADGQLALGLEAAHGRRRIVHARGDRTGHAILQAVIAAVGRTSSITVLEDMEARRLILCDDTVAGIAAVGRDGVLLLPTSRIVLATGGLGYLYRHTTNPTGSFGHGLALAASAGAELADMEFVQFHPTALDTGRDPMPLVSEAVRGEGAVLIDENGARFTDELQSRDVVSRAVWRRIELGHRTFLDARTALGARFATRFPGIDALCKQSGIDPATMPIPVRPAAHYHMGGVAVDAAGRSSVPGLWACGEVAATGLHGANRLASNSLLEAVVCGQWVAESVAGTVCPAPHALPPVDLPPSPDPTPMRGVMDAKVGVVRDADSLREAIAALLPLAESGGAASQPATVALLVAVAAFQRRESRGSHWRSDFPAAESAARHSRLRLNEALALAHDIAAEPLPRAIGGKR